MKILEKYLFLLEFYDADAIEEIDIKLLSFPETVIKLNKGELVIQGVIEKLNKLYESLISSAELNRKTILYYSKNGFSLFRGFQLDFCNLMMEGRQGGREERPSF